MSRQDVERLLSTADIQEAELSDVINLLVWFGVLGIFVSEDEERYSYQFEHDPKRMLAGLGSYAYCIHPAFRCALNSR
jgi:hypothetical protein